MPLGPNATQLNRGDYNHVLRTVQGLGGFDHDGYSADDVRAPKRPRAGLVLWLLELTEDVQFPDDTRTAGDATEPDVPWADNCQRVGYDVWDAGAAAGNVYAPRTGPITPTLYFPVCWRNANDIAIGASDWQTGDRLPAVWSEMSRRWECLLHVGQALNTRCGKLDDALGAGNSQTVSLWEGAGGERHLWDQDSGDDVIAYAPPWMTFGTIPADSWVHLEWWVDRWVVVDWQPLSVTLQTTYQVDVASRKFQKKQRQNIALPLADDESGWIDVHTGSVCP